MLRPQFNRSSSYIKKVIDDNIDSTLTKDWQRAYKLIVTSCPILITVRPKVLETLTSITSTPFVH